MKSSFIMEGTETIRHLELAHFELMKYFPFYFKINLNRGGNGITKNQVSSSKTQLRK